MEDISDVINEILVGRRVIYTNVDAAPIILCRGLTGAEKVISEVHYRKALNDAISLSIPKEKELIKILEDNGDWGPHYENKILNTDGEIKLVSKNLVTVKYQAAQRRTLLRKLEILKNRLTDLLNRRNNLVSNSAESYAVESRYFWNIHKMAFRLNNEPLWRSYEEMENYDREDVINIVQCYIKSFILDISSIRKVARSGLWRIYFTSCKNSKDLFDKPLCDLDVNQLQLLYWSNVYENAFSAMDPPEDDVVENDELFDAWIDEYVEKQKKERVKNKLGKIAGNSTKGKNSIQQVFVMADDDGAGDLYEDVGKPEICV